MTLNVYKKNIKSFEFYLSQGFVIVGEKKDEHTKCSEYIMSVDHEAQFLYEYGSTGLIL